VNAKVGTPRTAAAFMADLSRDDWYGRALSIHTGLGSGTVLKCLYRLENWGWLESRWEDREVATADGRPRAAVLAADRRRAAWVPKRVRRSPP
jgi:DNA-binding PadR family transcriptional regulator